MGGLWGVGSDVGNRDAAKSGHYALYEASFIIRSIGAACGMIYKETLKDPKGKVNNC